MILADTSVWVGWLRRRIDLGDIPMKQIVTCGPVLQEVFQGLEDRPLFTPFRDSLLLLKRLDDPVPLDVFLEAADIYREGRRRGLTIRSTVDCLIAAIAIRHDVTVWHQDRDFEHIARFRGLRTIQSQYLT